MREAVALSRCTQREQFKRSTVSIRNRPPSEAETAAFEHRQPAVINDSTILIGTAA